MLGERALLESPFSRGRAHAQHRPLVGGQEQPAGSGDELRDHAQREEIAQRIANQWTDEKKMGFADFQKHRSEIHEFESNNMKDQIIGFINALPEKQKAVIHLKDVEDFDVVEIGEILEMEQNAVRANLMRARQKVKEQILKLMDFENKMIENL